MAPSAGDTYNYHYHGTVNNVTNNYAGKFAEAGTPAPSQTGSDGATMGCAARTVRGLRRRREWLSSGSSGSGSESDDLIPPPGCAWLIGIVGTSGGEPHHLLVSPDDPLRVWVGPAPLSGGIRVLYNGRRLGLDRSPREMGLRDGAILHLEAPPPPPPESIEVLVQASDGGD